MDHEIREEPSPAEDHVQTLVVLVLVGVSTALPRSPAAWLSLPENRPKVKQAQDEEKVILSMQEGKLIRVYMLLRIVRLLSLVIGERRRKGY
jgi:hypothetical protein